MLVRRVSETDGEYLLDRAPVARNLLVLGVPVPSGWDGGAEAYGDLCLRPTP